MSIDSSEVDKIIAMPVSIPVQFRCVDQKSVVMAWIVEEETP